MSMRNSGIIVLVLALVAVVASYGMAQEVELAEMVVDDFSSDGWGLTLGSEFPGAKGGRRLKQTEFTSAPSSLCIDYDLTGGGHYVGVFRGIEMSRRAEAISFRARITSDSWVVLRLVDGSGQTHQSRYVPLAKPDAWQEMVFPIDKESFPQHWGGAKDGSIQFPVKSLLIAAQVNSRAQRAGQEGKLYLDDLAFLMGQGREDSEWESYEQTVEIVFKDEAAADKATVRVTPLYNDYEWAVTCRWDDNNRDAGIIVRDLMKKHGYRGTFYLNRWVSPWGGNDFRRAAQEFMAGDNSIGNHSLSHPMINVCNRNRIFEEMARNRAEWEAITDSQVSSYAFSYTRSAYWGATGFIKAKGESIRPDLRISLGRAGIYHVATAHFGSHKKLIRSPFMPFDGKDIDGFVQKTLENRQFKTEHPVLMFSMHAWAYTKEKERDKLDGQFEKYGSNPNWWYCNQNEYAAYRYQYEYSKLMPLQRDGRIARLNLERPLLLDLNDPTPLTLKITGVPAQDVVAVKCSTAESSKSDRQENGFSFHLEHDRDQTLPDKIGLITNNDNQSAVYADQDPDFPGLRGVLHFGDKMLHLTLKNQTGLSLTRIRITYRLPLAWDEGVVRRSMAALEPGSEYEDTLHLISRGKDYQYTAGQDYFVAQVDFRLGGEAGRLHLSCHADAQPRDASFPQGGFVRLGPLDNAKLAVDDLVAALGDDSKATDVLSALSKSAGLKWQRDDTPLMHPFLSPQFIRTTGSWQNWKAPRPQFWVLWSLLESDGEQDAEFVFASPNDRLFVNGIEAVKDGSVGLVKGRNVVVMVNREYRHSEFCPGSFLRALKPSTTERLTNIRFRQPLAQ